LSYASSDGVKEYIAGKAFDKAEANVEKIRQKILSLQSVNVVKLSSIKVNFAKDSAERKTPAYLERRLETLQEAWNKIVDLNDALKLIPSKSDQYLTQEVFKRSKAQYAELKATMEKMMKKNDSESTSTSSVSTSTSTSTLLG
jgi:hypothetical protein